MKERDRAEVNSLVADIEAALWTGEIFLWIAIISSAIVIFAYEIWNIVVVVRWLRRITKGA